MLMASSPIQRILTAVDLSSCSRAALAFACSLARTCGARLEVLLVHPSSTTVAAAPAVQGMAESEELRAFIASVPGTTGLALSQRIESGDPRQCIVALAEAGEFDAIVLGTHGRTGRARSLAGSVAEGVVRTASCPVITVREPR
jgi:nucleotide-binding universal stress UspA family protein